MDVQIIQKFLLQKKIGEYIPCGYSILTIWTFDQTKNKHTLYRGKDCMKTFCESFKKHTKNIIDFEKKKMLLLTKKELKSHTNANVCYICGKRILEKPSKNINYHKVRDHCRYTGKYSYFARL